MSRLKIEYRETNTLKEYDRNPRRNEAAVEGVANSISEFGFRVPIVIDRNGVIIAGHTRLKAAKMLGLAEVPVIVADDLSPEQVKAFRLADNKVAEVATWDEGLLELELQNILSLDMSDFGFSLDMGFLDEPMEEEYTEAEEYSEEEEYDAPPPTYDPEPEIIEEDEPPEEIDESYAPRCEEGDMFILGEHRLLCADSTKRENIERLMQGKIADLVFTDPPYGMGKDGVLNDGLTGEALLEFNREWIPLSFEFLKDNGSWYCWGTDEPLMDIYSAILKPMIAEKKIIFRQLLTWDKHDAPGQRSGEMKMYAVADEKCLFVQCGARLNANTEDYLEAWDAIRIPLREEADRVGLTPAKLKEITGVGMYNQWFSKSQWALIPEEHYNKLREYYKGEAFTTEYREIYRQYMELSDATRAYFNNTPDNMNSIWHFSRAGTEERTEHVTPKPLALCARGILSSSRRGEVVLDLFGGAGSTMMACEQVGRKCYMMELSPQWCDLIINRWERISGKKAVKV